VFDSRKKGGESSVWLEVLELMRSCKFYCNMLLCARQDCFVLQCDFEVLFVLVSCGLNSDVLMC
jgi:hypothetical protein